MKRRRGRLAVGFGMVASAGIVALSACEDDLFVLPPFAFDASLPAIDAATADVSSPDATPEASAPDASPDASTPLDPLVGIWRGIGRQGSMTWTILTDIRGGARGSVVGIMTYPSLACGGTLVFPLESDAGVPDAAVEIPDGGDGGPSITLHESVSATCIQEGEDTFTLLPDGTVYFTYRVSPSSPVMADGVLTRVGQSGAASSTFGGTWRAGDVNDRNLRSLLFTVSRDDSVGAPSGVFLVAKADGIHGCGGHWTLAGKTGSSLSLTEVFADEQIQCDGPGTAVLTRMVGDALSYARTVDGGSDAGAEDASVSRF